ncbi:serine/threonine-protein kinase ATG1a isoform X1 [Cucurbita pepo subsp. pepo]|uniref:serine/threonine-protein kinase ATG1a isoform X1 n=1 Tax=Cucurbita pepo subsp. pepo TaxID=3664 RepID=UPI000C9D4CF1|nr:serine/threonine-protein kinase ATG1a isoform X1 [Cucurbita pepo subsp. pepo]
MDFDDIGSNQGRSIGDYILGPRIGSGSFAVVWKSRHRHLGTVVAVKEIDKTHLNPKVSDSLLKEISILSTINHPNITRLFEAIQTDDRIFLVLEYCDGGDLGGYINRHGKVSEVVARGLMRQLGMLLLCLQLVFFGLGLYTKFMSVWILCAATGLKVLQEKQLIHRDLKPQNLLLTSNNGTPLLKIGDFGFARSLSNQSLADTLCGSPLYMAPEIIQNQRYDAKADLWSVGAILFQLLTGKPPFSGNSPFQLFQNILESTEPRFPKGALEELHPDALNLCRGLLRQNPVERLTFKEFFDHKFFEEPRSNKAVEEASEVQPIVSASSESATDNSQLERPIESSNRDSEIASSSVCNRISGAKNIYSSGMESVQKPMLNLGVEELRKSLDSIQQSMNQFQVSDSMESIEKDYVIVNAHCTSLEASSYHLETSLQGSSRVSHTLSIDRDMTAKTQKELIGSTRDTGETSCSRGRSSMPCAASMLREVQGLPILHPSTRLQLFQQYVQVLSDLSQEKYNAGTFLESFSVELVALALWQKAVEISETWLSSSAETESSKSSSRTDSTPLQKDPDSAANKEENVDFNRPSLVSKWAELGFIAAVDQAEKLSQSIQETDGATKMPDAIEIIFQKAIALGKSGAVDEYMENKDKAVASYSRAILLFSFILGEAESLEIKPPFSLTSDNKRRIQHYIHYLQTRTNLLTSQP